MKHSVEFNDNYLTLWFEGRTGIAWVNALDLGTISPGKTLRDWMNETENEKVLNRICEGAGGKLSYCIKMIEVGELAGVWMIDILAFPYALWISPELYGELFEYISTNRDGIIEGRVESALFQSADYEPESIDRLIQDKADEIAHEKL